jgi:hypothetical protein
MDGGPFVNVYLFGSRIFDPLTTSSREVAKMGSYSYNSFPSPQSMIKMLPPFKCYHFFKMAIFKIEATGDFHYIHWVRNVP